MKQLARKCLGKVMQVAGVAGVLAAATISAHAQTDLTTTVSTVSTLWSSVEVIGISVIVFVIGRRIVKKI